MVLSATRGPHPVAPSSTDPRMHLNLLMLISDLLLGCPTPRHYEPLRLQFPILFLVYPLPPGTGGRVAEAMDGAGEAEPVVDERASGRRGRTLLVFLFPLARMGSERHR
jgi:hypothetical protein